jgi:hypothetical protein
VHRARKNVDTPFRGKLAVKSVNPLWIKEIER